MWSVYGKGRGTVYKGSEKGTCVCRGGTWVVLVCRVCVLCCFALSLPSHHLVPPSSVYIDYVGYGGYVTDDKDKRLQRTH